MDWLPVALAFLLGSIPSAILVGRTAGVDVRREGSGNPGATNTWRTVGRPAGVVVLVFDVFKGWAAVSWLPALVSEPSSWLPAAVGAAAVLGHVFNPFLGFRGGKGVATSAGVFAALAPRLLIVPLALFVIVFAARRRVAEASLVAVLSLPLAALAWRFLSPEGQPGRQLLILTFGLAVLLLWAHRDNVRRIRSGDEPRLKA